VFEAQRRLEAEKKQEQMNQAKSGGGSGRRRNQMGGQSPTASRTETVRYNSEGDRNDDDVLEVI